MTATNVDTSLKLLAETYQVNEAAHFAIASAMSDGVRHGYAGNWQGQSCAVHVAHAFQHLEHALKDGLMGDEAGKNMEHALCRLAMALLQWSQD